MKNEALIMSWRHEEQIAHIHVVGIFRTFRIVMRRRTTCPGIIARLSKPV